MRLSLPMFVFEFKVIVWIELSSNQSCLNPKHGIYSHFSSLISRSVFAKIGGQYSETLSTSIPFLSLLEGVNTPKSGGEYTPKWWGQWCPKYTLPNRLAQFRQYLQQYHLRVEDNYELLLLLSNPNTRQQLHHQFQMDTSTLLRHAELADLMQIGMTELDAQILHFSQRNYQNPFTGSTIHLQILAEADAESLLQDMGGWMAGKENALLQNYCLSIKDIEYWIAQANTYHFKIFAQNS